MQLIIKVLKGGECQLEVNETKSHINVCFLTNWLIYCVLQVDENVSVLELKKEISKALSIPVPRQKILHVGRTLADDKSMSAFPQIKSGAKLTVVIKEPEPLKDVMCKLFKKYYSDEQSEAMAKEFMIDLEKRLDQLSFDDFERMATYFIERDRKLYGDT